MVGAAGVTGWRGAPHGDHISRSLRRDCRGSSLPSERLMLISETLAALTQTPFSGSAMACAASVDSSSPRTHHRRVQVSSSRFTLLPRTRRSAIRACRRLCRSGLRACRAPSALAAGDQPSDGAARAAEQDLLALLHAVKELREVRLRLIYVHYGFAHRRSRKLSICLGRPD